MPAGALVAIEGGTFVMVTDRRYGCGEDGEGPAHRVDLSSFWISRYAVTNAQFAAFLRATGYRTEAQRFGWSFVFAPFLPEVSLRRARWSARRGDGMEGADWAHPEGPHSTVNDRSDHPVVHVSWNDARAIHDAESAVAGREWERAWIASQIAMNVTRRTLLAGHDGAWVDDRRGELGAAYIRSLATLAAAALQLGEAELLTAQRAARELVAVEPLSEGATALLMRSLHARGERPAALVAHDEFDLRLRTPSESRPDRSCSRALRARHSVTGRQRRANGVPG